MPNWVNNFTKVSGDKKQIKELFELFKDGVDFEKITPMPEEIHNTDCPVRYSELTDEEKERYAEIKKKYGVDNWYDWACDHWGTKWNVVPQETLVNSDYQTLDFNTAWATPFEFFLSLSLKFPKLEFEVKFADEDIGYNCGIVIYKNGSYEETYVPEEGTREAKKFANEVWGWES